MMKNEAVKERKPTPTLVEDEFVLHVLEQYAGIQGELMQRIRRDFDEIERFGGRQGERGPGFGCTPEMRRRTRMNDREKMLLFLRKRRR